MPNSQYTVQKFSFLPPGMKKNKLRPVKSTIELPSSLTYSPNSNYYISENNSVKSNISLPPSEQASNVSSNDYLHNTPHIKGNDNIIINGDPSCSRIYSTASYIPKQGHLIRFSITAIPSQSNNEGIMKANQVSNHIRQCLEEDQSWFNEVTNTNSIEPLKKAERKAFEDYKFVNRDADNVKLYQLSSEEWSKITGHKISTSSPTPTSSIHSRSVSPPVSRESPWNSDNDIGTDSGGDSNNERQDTDTSQLISSSRSRTSSSGSSVRSKTYRRTNNIIERFSKFLLEDCNCLNKDRDWEEESLPDYPTRLFD